VGKPEGDQPTAVPVTEIQKWNEDSLVEWWGWHNNMEEIYPKAHIFCLPTYYKEGVPKVLIEAAACGRPLIATDVPGCREIVQDGVNGILIPPKNAIALANAVEKLVVDTALRVQMGKKSRKIAVDNFSAQKIISEYLDLYQTLDMS
jgi:glycosyltransferase involved in cell wall biosynthesis